MEGKKIILDLDIIGKSKVWEVACSYYLHPMNDGGTFLREKATFSVFCRHCPEGTCVRACPKDALERGEDGIVSRNSMMCVKCNSCIIACPFGTILEKMIPYATSMCDECLGRLRSDEIPLCAESSSDGSINFGDFSADEENRIFRLSERVLVHTSIWEKDSRRR